LFMFAHSLGGIYGIWCAANHPTNLDGLVLAAPAVACAISNTYTARAKIMQNDSLETWALTERLSGFLIET
jgi:alpha-beta hydrolase superfamily lysophospholipase